MMDVRVRFRDGEDEHGIIGRALSGRGLVVMHPVTHKPEAIFICYTAFGVEMSSTIPVENIITATLDPAMRERN
jgi:hypothetical protein